MTIKDLQKESHKLAKEKGWWSKKRSIGESLALIHSEISEALEEHRRGRQATEIYLIDYNQKPAGFPIELADTMIRIADLAEKLGIDLTEAIRMKTEYNRTRPYRHGGKVL